MDVAGIIAYENGDLDNADTIRLFASLIESGLAWQLQGAYGRMASHLIESGHIDEYGNITEYGYENM